MEIALKKASINDAKFIYKIRNEFNSRKFSKNRSVIKFSDHLFWLKNKIKSNSDFFYIITKKQNIKKKISYIRFEKSIFFYTVSIGIEKKYQNQKLSYKILNLAEKKLIPEKLLIAEVNSANSPAIKLFKKLEYTQIGRKSNFMIFAKITKNNAKIKKYLDAIKKIENVRNKNNINWMDILKVSFKHSPKNSKEIFKKISINDKEINHLSKNLSK